MKKIGMIGLVVALILWLIWAVGGIRKEDGDKLEELQPTPTAEPTPIEEPSRTGALYITPTKDEAREIEEIKKLKENCPIENDEFKLIFEYETSKFGVKLKTDYKEDLFFGWLANNGYGNIGKQYFLIED